MTTPFVTFLPGSVLRAEDLNTNSGLAVNNSASSITLLTGSGRDTTISDQGTFAKISVANNNPLAIASPSIVLLSGTGRDTTISDGSTDVQISVANSNPLWLRSPFVLNSTANPIGKTEFQLNGWTGNSISLTGNQTYRLLAGTAALNGSTSADQSIYTLNAQSGMVNTGPNGFYALSSTVGIVSGAGGAHTALSAQVNVASGSTGLTSLNLVGAQMEVTTAANCGGTSGTPAGRAYGIYGQCGLNAGATYYSLCSGGEIDIGVLTGASAAEVDGLSIVLLGSHATHGLNGRDSGIVFGSGSPSTGWDYGIRFGGIEASSPFMNTASLLWIGRTMTLNYGWDASNATFTSGFLKSNGFLVDGSGNTTAHSLNVTSNGGHQINGVTALYMDAATTPNLYLGALAGSSITSGLLNTFVGSGAGQSVTTGSENVLVGPLAGQFVTTGGFNTFLGEHAGGYATTESFTTAVGNDAYRNVVSAQGANVAVGKGAMYGGGHRQCVAVGMQAMIGNSSAVVISGSVTPTDSISLTFTGGFTGSPVTVTAAMTGLSTLAQAATAVWNACTANTNVNNLIGGTVTSGIVNNTTLSFVWQGTSTTGQSVVVTSSVTGSATEIVTVSGGCTSNWNIALGYQAMRGYAMSSAFECIGIGTNALDVLTTGNSNTAVGHFSGQNVTSGSGNTIFGTNSGTKITTGNNNLILGPSVASTTLATGNNNILIGAGSAIDAATSGESNTFRIGNNATNLMRATGINSATPAFFLDWLPGSTTYASDSAAATGGISIGQIYRNGSVVQCRIS